MSKHTYLSSRSIGLIKRGSVTARESDTSQLQEPELTLTGFEISQKALMPPRYASGCYSIRFAPGGGALVGGFGNGAVLMYEKDAQGLFTQQSTLRKGSRYADDTIMAVRFHPKQSKILYSCAIFGTIFRHNLAGKPDEKCEKFAEENNNRINAIDLNMAGELLASGGKDLSLRIYDTQTKELIQEYKGYHPSTPQKDSGGHALSVFCIKFHPDQRDVLLTGGWDDTIKIWDMRTDAGMIGSLGGPHICGEAIDIKGETVVTGSWKADQAIQLWDLRQRLPIKSLTTFRKTHVEGDNIYAVQFARSDPDGHHLLTAGSGTNSFQYINHMTEKVIGTGATQKPFSTVDSTGQVLAAAGGRLDPPPARARPTSLMEAG
ncbi:WD repeat-containing protein tag-125-like [Amphibalanus amphitrite]|uniref:WD repeat-containing protein tag-125-like n=1 Tax=Amphibalanus amphitrite TaxID=1232801 RepID=UPI001C927A84|nr:WD repeat-containing protein tag-125-like [Amphibalanus amphitrite]